MYLYEDNAEALARHLILLAVFLDRTLQPDVRMQRFLEIFGNALMRQDTATYLNTKSQELESMLAQMMAGKEVPGELASLIDISMLSYQDQDALLSVISGARDARQYDMKKAWDGRCRIWYAERYDFRQNMVRTARTVHHPPCGPLNVACQQLRHRNISAARLQLLRSILACSSPASLSCEQCHHRYYPHWTARISPGRGGIPAIIH
jgi:hypothetical protein